jgi:hypothetical protein
MRTVSTPTYTVALEVRPRRRYRVLRASRPYQRPPTHRHQLDPVRAKRHLGQRQALSRLLSEALPGPHALVIDLGCASTIDLGLNGLRHHRQALACDCAPGRGRQRGQEGARVREARAPTGSRTHRTRLTTGAPGSSRMDGRAPGRLQAPFLRLGIDRSSRSGRHGCGPPPDEGPGSTSPRGSSRPVPASVARSIAAWQRTRT